jgi:lipopolysaccharide transport system ATP-binding protein
LGFDSMSDVAIRTENLSKLYRIGEHQGNYKTLRETIVNIFSAPFRQLIHKPQPSTLKPQSEFIWALKDISYEVKRGEVVGIIGRNGAGKTTMLKILSRITEPTEGLVEIRGRVGSLLEVGTGFHPELTGRENIYLNGAILGMKKSELNRKFDEIVAFAEIEKFMETPVKRYSSGMYVRLAFAVAAHLEPEILLVDEVLAVGDATFQKKCLGKMGEVASEGRTVLFVSHNMQSLLRICSGGILLDRGQIQASGPIKEIVERYLSSDASIAAQFEWADHNASGDKFVRLRSVRVCNDHGQVSSIFYLSQSIRLEIEFECLLAGRKLNPAFIVNDGLGNCLFATANHHEAEWSGREYTTGLYRSTCIIPEHFLNEGLHQVRAKMVVDGSKIYGPEEPVVFFRVLDDGTDRGEYVGHWMGAVRPLLPWETESLI